MVKASLRIKNPWKSGFIHPGETAEFDETTEKALVAHKTAVFTTEKAAVHHEKPSVESSGVSTAGVQNGVSGESKEAQNNCATCSDLLGLKAATEALLAEREEGAKLMAELIATNEALLAENDLLKAEKLKLQEEGTKISEENETLHKRVAVLEKAAKVTAKSGSN